MKRVLVLALTVVLVHAGSVVAQVPAHPVPPEHIPSWLPGPGVRIVPFEQQVLPPEEKARIRENLRSLRERGYVEATDEEIANRNRHEGLEDAVVAAKKLARRPSGVGPTLGRASRVAAAAHGTHGPRGSNMFTRLFHVDDMQITLEEMDLATGGVLLSQEFLNASVNGRPAILVVEKSPNQAMTTLAW